MMFDSLVSDHSRHRAVLAMSLLMLLAVVAPRALAAEIDRVNDCRIGSYLLRDGSRVDIGATDGNHFRWRREDGTTGVLTETGHDTWSSTYGWTERPDGKQVSFSRCKAGRIVFDGLRGRRIPLTVTDTEFDGAGARLAGRLVMPPDSGAVPIVVLVHGSEHFSGRDFYALQRQLPAAGVGAFVYDKRGTGASGGLYTQDYLTLATDAVAASREAKRLAGSRAAAIGYQGSSQGGWVAPLAARIEPVDFLMVAYGLAVSPIEEDREAIALDMERHGFGAEITAKAMAVADATAVILRSGFRDGYERVAEMKSRFGNEDWFARIRGNISGVLLQTPEADLRAQGPVMLAGVPADYDPMPVLRNLSVPQLWILGADDRDAPVAETVRRLRQLIGAGKPITLALFPHAEHGLLEYETRDNGERVSTRNPEGYFAMMRDFARARSISGQYGTSSVSGPTRSEMTTD